MKRLTEGWVDRETLYIPPAAGGGFKEKIIIRENILPQRKQKTTDEKKYSGDAPTVFVSDTYYGDDETVLVQENQKLAVIKRMKTGEFVLVSKDDFVIGKQTGTDYVIRDNQTISRRHARLYRKDGSYWLEDLNSSNHVFIDDRRIDSPVKLSDRMKFRLSDDEEFEFIEEGGEIGPDDYGK